MKAALLVAGLVLAMSCVGVASAGEGAQNLVLYPGLAHDLHVAHGGGVGPLLGYRCFPQSGGKQRTCKTFHIYYARYRGNEYAAGVFWNKVTGFTDSVNQFKRTVGGRWRLLGDGWPPECGFPAPVVRVWAWRACR